MDGDRKGRSEVSTIGTIYEHFAHEYGFTREYIQGTWTDGKLTGLTRPLLRLYWNKLQTRKLQELKLQAAFSGIDLGETGGDRQESPEVKLNKAKERLEDPLREFPNDISYLNSSDCEVKIRLTSNPKLALPFEQKWNAYRKECCLGDYGQAAKRCSMNDTLWKRYLASTEAGRPLVLDAIKAMVEFDMLRRELYPLNYQGHPDADPPKEYIVELKKSGKYTDILQRLHKLTQRIQNSGS